VRARSAVASTQQTPRLVELTDEMEIASPADAISAQVEAHEALVELAGTCRRVLDPLEREVLALSASGAKREEIAQHLQISVETVRATLQRSRRRLRPALDHAAKSGDKVAPRPTTVAALTARGDRERRPGQRQARANAQATAPVYVGRVAARINRWASALTVLSEKVSEVPEGRGRELLTDALRNLVGAGSRCLDELVRTVDGEPAARGGFPQLAKSLGAQSAAEGGGAGLARRSAQVELRGDPRENGCRIEDEPSAGRRASLAPSA
jgi:hypothetical protein